MLAAIVCLSGCGEKTQGPGFVISGAEEGERMSGKPCGDVNGDGYEDILVLLEGATTSHRAYLVFGKSDEEHVDVAKLAEGAPGSESLGRMLQPDSPDLYLFEVVEVGDINGDGFADLASVGAAENDSIVHVIYGQTELPSPLRPAEFVAGGDGFAIEAPPASRAATAGVGDINGDGFDDLVVSFYYSGGLYFVYGGQNPESRTVDELMMGDGGFHIGRGESFRAGDLNGDGFDDLVALRELGSYFNGAALDIALGGPNFGPVSLLEDSDARLTFSYDAIIGGSRAGDVNGDGFDDLVFSYYSGNIAYVVFGAKELGYLELGGSLGDRGYTIEVGDRVDDGYSYFGRTQIVFAGDRDDDGLDDLIIRGLDATYLAPGKPDIERLLLSEGGLLLDGLPLGEHLGRVSGVGAIRGEGPKDLVISDIDANVRRRKNSGAVYVLFDPALAP